MVDPFRIPCPLQRVFLKPGSDIAHDGLDLRPAGLVAFSKQVFLPWPSAPITRVGEHMRMVVANVAFAMRRMDLMSVATP